MLSTQLAGGYPEPAHQATSGAGATGGARAGGPGRRRFVPQRSRHELGHLVHHGCVCRPRCRRPRRGACAAFPRGVDPGFGGLPALRGSQPSGSRPAFRLRRAGRLASGGGLGCSGHGFGSTLVSGGLVGSSEAGAMRLLGPWRMRRTASRRSSIACGGLRPPAARGRWPRTIMSACRPTAARSSGRCTKVAITARVSSNRMVTAVLERP